MLNTKLWTYVHGENSISVLTLKNFRNDKSTTNDKNKMIGSDQKAMLPQTKSTFTNNNIMTYKSETSSPGLDKLEDLQNTALISTERRPLHQSGTPNKAIMHEESISSLELESQEEDEKLSSALQSFTEGVISVRASHSQFKKIEDFQRMHGKKRADIFRNLMTGSFIAIMLVGLCISIVQYGVLRQSVTDFSFASQVIRMSYQRLTALCWIWRYNIAFFLRITGTFEFRLFSLNPIKIISLLEFRVVKFGKDFSCLDFSKEDTANFRILL